MVASNHLNRFLVLHQPLLYSLSTMYRMTVYNPDQLAVRCLISRAKNVMNISAVSEYRAWRTVP